MSDKESLQFELNLLTKKSKIYFKGGLSIAIISSIIALATLILIFVGIGLEYKIENELLSQEFKLMYSLALPLFIFNILLTFAGVTLIVIAKTRLKNDIHVTKAYLAGFKN